MLHIDESCHTYEWVVSHAKESCHTYEQFIKGGGTMVWPSRLTYECGANTRDFFNGWYACGDMTHLYVIWLILVWHDSLIHVTWLILMWSYDHSHVTHMVIWPQSCHTYEWVVSHTWMSHVTHMNESYHIYDHTYECVTPHKRMSHATYTRTASNLMNESCHIWRLYLMNEPCHIWRLYLMNEPCHIWRLYHDEWAMSHKRALPHKRDMSH